MSNFILGFVIGGIVIYFITLAMRGKESVTPKTTVRKYNTKAEEEKAKNMAKLKDFIVNVEGKITNNQVEDLLKVSDATTERYLDELEKEGFIKQVGKEGQSVYYEKVWTPQSTEAFI